MLYWMCVFGGEHTFDTICVAFLRNTALDAGKEVLVITSTLEVDPFAVFGGGAGTALFLDGVSMVHSIMTRYTLGMDMTYSTVRELRQSSFSIGFLSSNCAQASGQEERDVGELHGGLVGIERAVIDYGYGIDWTGG